MRFTYKRDRWNVLHSSESFSKKFDQMCAENSLQLKVSCSLVFMWKIYTKIAVSSHFSKWMNFQLKSFQAGSLKLAGVSKPIEDWEPASKPRENWAPQCEFFPHVSIFPASLPVPSRKKSKNFWSPRSFTSHKLKQNRIGQSPWTFQNWVINLINELMSEVHMHC